MAKIITQEDCGNAPKKLFVKEFIVAMVNNDLEFVGQNVADDIQWNMVGAEIIQGKDTFLKSLRRSRGGAILELTIHTIVTHGYDGVAEGVLKLKDGRMMAFCDVYRFKASTNNAPIKAISTYAIPLP